MPDWTKPMQQTYEYYIVDPATWRDTGTAYEREDGCNNIEGR